MRKKIISLALLAIFISSFSFIGQEHKVDYVPDEATAKKIAEAIWFPIYGKSILNEKPYNVELRDEVWIVTGTLNPKYVYGGVAYIEIQKSDCKILKVTHGK